MGSTIPSWGDPSDDDVDASRTPSDAASAMERAIATSVPADAVAFFARWWQLENWLRTLAYLELRAAYGVAWTVHLDSRARDRAQQDQLNEYMPSPDADDLLSYMDTGALFSLLAKEALWPLFQRSLTKRERWIGMADQLRALRNRNSHFRRPHADDLARVEQALRDLEAGAHRAMRSYTTLHLWDEPGDDPVARAWVGEEHGDAQRLVNHAERQYEVDFSLWHSRRPWVTGVTPAVVTGTSGYLWHARWYGRGGRYVGPRALWSDYALDVGGARDLIVHMLHAGSNSVEVTFAAVDDASRISDAIGAIFDAVLLVSDRRPTRRMEAKWAEEGQLLGSRIQVGTALTMDDPSTSFSVFAAARR